MEVQRTSVMAQQYGDLAIDPDEIPPATLERTT